MLTGKALFNTLLAELNEMGLPGMSSTLDEMYRSPNFLELDPLMAIANLVEPEYQKKMNKRTNTVAVSFENAREAVNAMTSLPDEDIQDIQAKIDEIEEIVKSKDSKSKKWSKAKEIIKWIADKGVDVGIALLPLVLQIG